MTDLERRGRIRRWWAADEDSEIYPAKSLYRHSWMTRERLVLGVTAAAIAIGALSLI